MSEERIVCEDLGRALDDLLSEGFRIDVIYPADEPHCAILSRGDERVTLTTGRNEPLIADALVPFTPEFVLTRAGASAVRGRAGMFYRDLVPGRLGGRYVASHICIPDGGRVADWVHFHSIRLQMIFVRRGWVKLVYEDQGEPFVMVEGDMVLQPPEIRHRVLESSAGLEVVEITVPAVHATFSDHELELPNSRNPERLFRGQRFVRHVGSEVPWTTCDGACVQETGVEEATGSLAAVRLLSPARGSSIEFQPHQGELVFGFVVDGSAVLEFSGAHPLKPADAFVIPPEAQWRLTNVSEDLRLLHVTTAVLD